MTHNRLRYAAASDIGRHRSKNEDSVHAGERLLVIADGMGGHGNGEVASASAIGALSALEEAAPTDDPVATLDAAVRPAAR
jgi:serine/threonine protein phosphatase PrpC